MNERATAYIIRMFNHERGFDAININVEWVAENESIRITADDKTYTFNVGSDDDFYEFVNDADPTDRVDFAIENVLRFADEHLPALIRAQTEFVIDALERCQNDDRLAMMNTDDDDYVPAALRLLDALIACKIGHHDVHEIDLADMPHGQDCMPPEIDKFSIHPM